MQGHQRALSLPETVQSVVKTPTNAALLAAVAQLWIQEADVVLDVTYGRGRWWDLYRPETLITHDLAIDGVDLRALPELEASVDVVALDPPYITQGGRVTQGGRDTSIAQAFLNRYGLHSGPRDVAELLELYAGGIAEAHRVLRPGGRLLVKTMDFTNGRRFRPIRHEVVALARDGGLDQVDEFVHLSGSGPGKWMTQQHSRRVHSYLCVFRKRMR